VTSTRREAWKAYFKGDYLRAGDLYKTAGELEKASKMYIKAQEYRAAAEMEEALGRVSSAVDLLMRVGDPNSAAQILGRHGQFTRSAQIYGDAGNKVQAAAMALKGGNVPLASHYYEQSGRFMEAGRLSFEQGNVGKALLLFEKALKQLPSTEALTPSDQLQNREKFIEIAHYFERGEAYDRAAEIYENLNNPFQAAQCWEAAGQYEKALPLYKQVGALDRVSALTEHAARASVEVQAEALAAKGELEEAARLLARTGLKDRAASLLEESGNMAGAAELRREMGDFELAGNLFFRVQAYLPAAECFQEGHLYAMAKQCFLKAGDNRMASRMSFESGNWEEAVDLAPDSEERERLLARIQALPDNPSDRTSLAVLKARLFVDLGQYKVAMTCLDGLSPSRGDDESWRLYLLGRTNEAVGRTTDAAEMYSRVLALDMTFLDARSRLDGLTHQDEAQAVKKERYIPSRSLEEDALGPWFKAEDSTSGMAVLLHRLERRVEDRTSPMSHQDRFQRRMGLTHPGLLRLQDVAVSDGHLTLVYEDFDGRPLTQWLKEGYRPSLYGALEKLRQVLSALSENHKRELFHAHLSPASVWMDAEGKVIVQGLGIIVHFSDMEPSPAGDACRPFLPAPRYDESFSPTQRDLYGAGVLFLQLLIGEPPVLAGDDSGRGPDIAPVIKGLGFPEGLKEIVEKLVSLDPKGRYLSAEDALADLSAQEFPPGAIIAGRYEIVEELGRGGMGQVFRVKDRSLDEVVALKTLRKRADLTTEGRARFLREIKLSRKITHPNVVRVFDFGSWGEITFLTMEYIPGKTLSQWVRDGDEKKCNLRQKVEILRGIAAGLQEAHKLGIIHRDLKPQNVILTPRGIPKLLDFGIAFTQVGDTVDLTQDGHFVGSPKYVSPEQIQGQPLTMQSDIYSFGLLSYFVLAGQDAFRGDKSTLILLKQLKEMPPPPTQYTRLPPSLENLVMRCLSKKKSERPADLAEVSRLLKEIV